MLQLFIWSCQTLQTACWCGQDSDFDFGELSGLTTDKTVTTSLNITTSATSVDVTQQTLSPQLDEDGQSLVGDDAGSGVDVEEASGEELMLTTGTDDNITGTTTSMTTMEWETTTSVMEHETMTTMSAETTTTSSPQTTTTNATSATLTTEQPVSAEPGESCSVDRKIVINIEEWIQPLGVCWTCNQPVWAQEAHLDRFLAECRRWRLNHGRPIVLFCSVLHFFAFSWLCLVSVLFVFLI